MRTPRNRRALALVLAAPACMALPLTASGDGEAVSSMYATFWALVPPIVAIGLALITKEAAPLS